jgi:membrane protein implicated in regulation of membrane protease activity
MNAFALKAWLAGVGLVAGIVGMAFDLQWLIYVAVGFLAASFLLRFVKPRQGEADAQS